VGFIITSDKGLPILNTPKKAFYRGIAIEYKTQLVSDGDKLEVKRVDKVNHMIPCSSVSPNSFTDKVSLSIVIIIS
jgi:hypothetical protein